MYDVLQKPEPVMCWACEEEVATRYHWSKPLCQECYAKVTKAESDKWFKDTDECPSKSE